MSQQRAIRTEPTWKKYVLPLKDFMLVVRGYEGERSTDIRPERITSIGFLMAEVRCHSISSLRLWLFCCVLCVLIHAI